MHIPDGFLDAKTAAATGVLSIAGIALAVRQVRRQLPAQRVPLLGLAAAFVFATQMLNFPVAGGTSGHMVGGVLTAVLLGPGAAVLVLASVLIVQCLVFADGGLLALGANIFNMGIIASVAGYALYRFVRQFLPGPRGVIMASAFAAWCTTVAAAIVCAGELAVSGSVAWSVAFPAMANVHMLIGVGEALITALVLAAIQQTRPELIEPASTPTTRALRYEPVIGFGLLISLGLALFVSPFACPWPDGLDHVAKVLGFEYRAAMKPIMPAPMHNYLLPGFHSMAVAMSLAGCIGTLIALALAYLVARLLVPTSAGPSESTGFHAP